MVFLSVGLSWIIENNKHINFEMGVQDSQCMERGPWYNKPFEKIEWSKL